MDSEILNKMPGYSIFRCDRDNRDGGGVALILRDEMTGEFLSSFNNEVSQMVIVKIYKQNTVIAIIYRPPSTRLSEFSPLLKCLEDTLNYLPTPTPNILVNGDFNLPHSSVE